METANEVACQSLLSYKREGAVWRFDGEGFYICFFLVVFVLQACSRKRTEEETPSGLSGTRRTDDLELGILNFASLLC